MPAIFSAPIRVDIVQRVHTDLALNKRQPHAVSFRAGAKTSAESYGTGRALARIPRVKGSGTGRAGQGAFGNMCRGGRMFAPTKVWRKWHRKINEHQKYFAIVSAIAASAIPSLLMSHGHQIENVAEVPVVLAKEVEFIKKTKEAVVWMKACGAYDDVLKAIDSKVRRTSKSKWRNRTYSMKRGPLVVYGTDNGIAHAFRNIPSVVVADVRDLDLLELAPGGHVGRFIIWTESAFSLLDEVFGTFTTPSVINKKFMLPGTVMTNSDVSRIIESTEIQSVIREIRSTHVPPRTVNFNPLKNAKAMLHLNPYADKMKELFAAAAEERKNAPVDQAYLDAEAALIRTITEN